MLRKLMLNGLAMGLMLIAGAVTLPAQSIAPAQEYVDYDRTKIDRYLDVEVWSGHSDGEYYEGDNIVIYFRVNRDAFVTLYSIDTRGRVNLLFPTYSGEDNFIHGGVTYSLPGGDDDYDLVVSGPEGFENIQIIASRERFPIPDWYHGPELVADWDDRNEYMDWVNTTYFVRYGGQRFAYDRAVIYVNEWEEYYFRPVYYPAYPSWTLYGNCYIDYPWGASIYINGLYWGCAPLYLPRIAVGWHTITVYDYYGNCWEHDFHVSRYNTVVFNKTIIKTSPTVKSKYKEVRTVGYRNPVRSGYPNFESRKMSMAKAIARSNVMVTKGTRSKSSVPIETTFESIPKKYVRGSTKIVKTDRGYETDASTAVFSKKKMGLRGSTDRTYKSVSYGDGVRGSKGKSTVESGRLGRSGSSGKSTKSTSGGSSIRPGGGKVKSGSSGTIQKKSGTSSSKRKTSGNVRLEKKSTSSKSNKSTPRVEKRKSSGKNSSGSIKKESGKSKPSSSGSSKKEEKKVKPSSSKKSSSSATKSSSSKAKGDSKSGSKKSSRKR